MIEGPFQSGPMQVLVYLNHFPGHTKMLADDICRLLHSHGLDRDILVVVLPSGANWLSYGTRDKMYRLECRVGAVTSNTAVEADGYAPCLRKGRARSLRQR